MKFLHTSDWHLGAKLGDYSRLSEQKEILAEIRQIAEKENVDFVIIAGDIFDTFNPSNEAVRLLNEELRNLAAGGQRPILAIAGNHDSPDKIEAADPLAVGCGIFFIGYPDFVHSGGVFKNIAISFPEKGIIVIKFPDKPEVNILATPYANENRLRQRLGFEDREEKLSNLLSARWKDIADKYFSKEKINLLTAHLFMSDTTGELPVEPDGERSVLHPGGLELLSPAVIPELTQYVALGHLHKPQSIGDSARPIVYCGSPLAFGLSEEDQQKSVVVAEVEPNKEVQYKRVPLTRGRRILRKQFDDIDTAVLWLNKNKNCYVELIIECEDFISAEDRKRLYDTHDGITTLVPFLKKDKIISDDENIENTPDLKGTIEELFISFFKSEKGVPPNETMLDLFRQILSGQSEEGENL